MSIIECVPNISEGRDAAAVAAIADAVREVPGVRLLDVQSDATHHRSVLTFAGDRAPLLAAVLALFEATLARVDLRRHSGEHPRLGAVDVVPFVALAGTAPTEAVRARDEFARWLADTRGVPCFLYGPERSLPEVRRRAFHDLGPDHGPRDPHPSAGATAVGARDVLVAYNVWVDADDVATVRSIAAAVRAPAVRTLGLAVGDRFQVSMNLVAPHDVGPAEAFDRVVAAAGGTGAVVTGAELVGLVPAAVLAEVPAQRWTELDLAEDRTIEARLRR
jgi:glutamate formiminotransferase